MRRLPILTLAAGLMLALAACSSSTPYRPDMGRGGYAERLVSPDTAEVSFTASSATPPDLVRDLLLVRCAEVTQQRGFSAFQIIAANAPLNVSFDISETHLNSGDPHTLKVTITMFRAGQGPQGSQVAQAADVLRGLGPRADAARPR